MLGALPFAMHYKDPRAKMILASCKIGKLNSVLTPTLYLEIQIKKLLLKVLPAFHRKRKLCLTSLN